MNAMAHRSSGRRRHGPALGIALFAALSPQSPAPGADPPDPWTPELRAVIAKLEVGETEAATGKLTMLLQEYAGHGGPDAVYVDLIAHVDSTLTLRQAHDVADRIEEALQRAYPEIVDVIVHLEPEVGAHGRV